MNIQKPGPNAEDDPLGAAGSLLGGPARGMTETRTGYQTALVVHKPRVLADVEKRVLDEAARARDSFTYRWRQKDRNSKDADGMSTIEGVSIDGAMILLRNWGNAACPTRVADESPTHFIFEATFIDLETGFTLPRLYRQRKSESHGRYDNERAQDIAFQIAQSKCQRNAIVKGIPSWLQERATEAAKLALASDYSDPQKHIPKVIEHAQKNGVTKEQLQRKVGRPFEQWRPSDLVLLKLTFNSIKDRETTWAEEFMFEAPPLNVTGAPVPGQPIDVQGTPVDDDFAPEVPPAAKAASVVPDDDGPFEPPPPAAPAVAEDTKTAFGETKAPPPETPAAPAETKKPADAPPAGDVEAAPAACPQCGNATGIKTTDGVHACIHCGWRSATKAKKGKA